MDIVERLRKESYWALSGEAAEEIERLREQLKYSNEFREIMNEERCDALEENERLREALRNVLSVQPIKGDEGSTGIVSLAKALLEIDSIARAALKEKE